MKKYRKLHPDKPLPHITPHVFRHTFCTNYANAGMDIKNLQYLMGHSDAGVTLNVYTHASYSHAASQMVSLGRSESFGTTSVSLKIKGFLRMASSSQAIWNAGFTTPRTLVMVL